MAAAYPQLLYAAPWLWGPLSAWIDNDSSALGVRPWTGLTLMYVLGWETSLDQSPLSMALRNTTGCTGCSCKGETEKQARRTGPVCSRAVRLLRRFFGLILLGRSLVVITLEQLRMREGRCLYQIDEIAS